MVKVIDIKRTKKTTTLIFSNDTTLSISPDTVREFFIYTGKEISDNELHQIMSYEGETKHYQYALGVLNRGPYTVYEMKAKLRKRFVEEEVISTIISRLKDNNFLNDSLYAKERAAFLANHKKASRRAIKNDLIKKGIHPFLIEEVLTTLPEMEVAQVRFLMPKLIKQYGKESLFMAGMKINHKLMQDGFQSAAIKEAVSAFNLSDFINEDENLQKLYEKTIRQRVKAGRDGRKVVYNKLSQAGYPHHKIIQLLEENLDEN